MHASLKIIEVPFIALAAIGLMLDSAIGPLQEEKAKTFFNADESQKNLIITLLCCYTYKFDLSYI